MEAQWGGWNLKKDGCLVFPAYGTGTIDYYEVDLDSCTSTPEILDWIVQAREIAHMCAMPALQNRAGAACDTDS